MKSHSVEVLPYDGRCRYWAKVVRAGHVLSSPVDVQSAGCIPAPYLQRGEEELLPGDVLFEGEAKHHRHQRGWAYWLTAVTEDGDLIKFCPDFGPYKALLKSQGLSPDLLRGAGDIAAMVRIAHGFRADLKLGTEDI